MTALIVLIVAIIALIGFLIFRNKKDKIELENTFNNNYIKSKDQEGDMDLE